MLNGQARALWTWLCLIVTLLHGGIRAEASFARPDQALGTLVSAASKSPDPMGHGASMSLYDFANGDPVNRFDPDGRLATGFAGGATLGDYYQPKNTAQRIGHFFGQTSTGFVPVVGQAADVRDLSAAVDNLQSEGLNWGTATGVLIGGIGCIPILGDLVKGIAKPILSSLPNSQIIPKLSSVNEAPVLPAPPTKVTDDVAGVVDDAERGADDLVTVRTYTNTAGREGISNSGYLRADTWVTLPDQIPTRAGHLQIERILEIQPGRGSHFLELQVPRSNLRIPANGPRTSGGALQFQLNNPVPIDPSTFRRPPGRPGG